MAPTCHSPVRGEFSLRGFLPSPCDAHAARHPDQDQANCAGGLNGPRDAPVIKTKKPPVVTQGAKLIISIKGCGL